MKIFNKNLNEFKEPVLKEEPAEKPVPPPDGLDQNVLNVLLNNPKKMGILYLLNSEKYPISYEQIVDSLSEQPGMQILENLYELVDSGLVIKEQEPIRSPFGAREFVSYYSISDKWRDHVAYKFRDEI